MRGEVLSKLHRFTVLPKALPGQVNPRPLEKADMCVMNDPSLDFAPIRGTTPKAYFSPQAASVGQPVADMSMLQAISCEHQRLGSAWKGFFADATHCLAIRNTKVPNSSWLVALHHYSDSAVLAWPITMAEVRDTSGDIMAYLEFCELREPLLVAVLDFDDWESFRFDFKSWAWQCDRLPAGSRRDMKAAVRPFRCSPVDTILKNCARVAWFRLQKSDLAGVCDMLGIDMKKTGNLFDLLFMLTQRVLECSEQEPLDMMTGRFADMMQASSHSSEILSVDEAARTLDENDREELATVKEKATARAMELESFKQAYTKRQRQCGGTMATAARRVKKDYKGPKTLEALNRDHIGQNIIKQYFLAGSSVWRARRTNSWNARFLQFPVRSCKDTAWGGEMGAIRELLKFCWQWCLTCEGLEEKHCPIKGLLDDDGAATTT